MHRFVFLDRAHRRHMPFGLSKGPDGPRRCGMRFPLNPPDQYLDSDVILERFISFVHSEGFEMYPAQEEAILELYGGQNVILNTPTGSGKSLVATALHYLALCQGRRSVYTCPIKALVNEKFLALCRLFGPENVGMMTGDASVNRDALVLCCTAEILANIALRDGPNARVDDVVMDEFHYYSDEDRGVAWQAPLLTLPHVRFLLMSATLGDTRFFEKDLERATGRQTLTVSSSDRPVPLEFSFEEKALTEVLDLLQTGGKLPVYLVHFTQRAAAQTAQNLQSMTVCSKDEKAMIAEELEKVPFNSPFGKEIKRFIRNGIGLHHAGLLPRYRLLVEKLAQRGLLKVICGTDTLGVGVNVPIRTVLFTQLCKYDGKKTRILSARDFHQISGRAGRRGFDSIGYVVAMAPEHVIENRRLEAKAGDDPAKKRKIVRRKPPEKGYVHWDAQTFERLIQSKPEALESRFKVTHGMLLNVLSRKGDGCRAMRTLIADCHHPEASKPAIRRQAFQLFRSLLEREIVEILPVSAGERKLRVNVELQDDFSLNQTLSLYFVDTLALLDSDAPEYPFKVVSLAESIVEDPDAILRRQLMKVKEEKIAEWKAAGIEYDERMERLETLEYPKPERDFIYDTFNAFASEHPWVGKENIHPKSIVREMYESYSSFGDYIKTYGIEQVEGLLLRHLSQVYHVLESTLPPVYRTDPVDEVLVYLEGLLRTVDSSLLDEWERMKHPDAPIKLYADTSFPQSQTKVLDITANRDSFTKLVRSEVFRFVRMLANRQYPDIRDSYDLALLFPDAPAEGVGARDYVLTRHMDDYHSTHSWIRLDPEARAAKHTRIDRDDPTRWVVRQTLVDVEDLNDWEVVFQIDIAGSRRESHVVMIPTGLGPIGGE